MMLLFMVFSVNLFSQAKIKEKEFIGKNYWTKFVLPRESDCKIKITPNDISPSNGVCNFRSHLKTDSKLKLIAISDEKDWAKLTLLTNEEKEFEVYLKNDSKKNFKKAFKTTFSKKKRFKDSFYPYNVSLKTKLDVIRKLGFPTRIHRSDDSERWMFYADWVYFDFYNYDVTFIYFKDNKITEISGHI